jgi:hypothetical protein
MQSQFQIESKGLTADEVLASLRQLRVGIVSYEYDLQDAVSEQLQSDGIPFAKEYQLGPRNRIDFLVPGGIGIEIKKGRPNSVQLIAQAERYCRFDAVTTLILLIEKHATTHEVLLNGKPVHYIALNKLWGIAL